MCRRLYVIDDDPEIRAAIGMAAADRGFEVRDFCSAEAVLEEDELPGPGCILLDLRMPGIDGIELQRNLSELGTKLPIIVVSGNATVELAIQAFRQGAEDFMVKPVSSEQLFERIDELIDLYSNRASLERRAEEDREKYESLTNRERQVMHLLVHGMSGKQIAAALGISYRTMEKFRANVMRKFELQSVAELVHAAVRIGLDVLNNDGLDALGDLSEA
ncbi:MAG: response regulator transcription factor [Planctomycetota bacterium]|jgi:FixJ family two-component response regulator